VIIDEATICEALGDLTADVTVRPDLVTRAQQRGQTRLRRRRILVLGAVPVVVAATIVGAIAVIQEGPRTPTVESSASSLYAKPPTPTECAPPGPSAASPADYPNLLMLPPDQPVSYAFTNNHGSGCPAAHVALTMLRLHGGGISRSIDIEGPNAPSEVEAGYNQPDEEFSGPVLHPSVDGRGADVYYLPGNRSATIFWTDANGGQWQTSSASAQWVSTDC
jgi:hypothetical protein